MQNVQVKVDGTPHLVWKDDAGWYYTNDNWSRATVIDENGGVMKVVEAEQPGEGKSFAEKPHEWRFRLGPLGVVGLAPVGRGRVVVLWLGLLAVLVVLAFLLLSS